jgi:hypothetical protein
MQVLHSGMAGPPEPNFLYEIRCHKRIDAPRCAWHILRPQLDGSFPRSGVGTYPRTLQRPPIECPHHRHGSFPGSRVVCRWSGIVPFPRWSVGTIRMRRAALGTSYALTSWGDDCAERSETHWACPPPARSRKGRGSEKNRHSSHGKRGGCSKIFSFWRAAGLCVFLYP